MKYVFADYGSIKKKLKSRNIFLLLDFDGTLSPIARTPRQAVLAAAERRFLRRLSHDRRFKLAIISGRELGDIRRKVNIKNIVYAANHGLEICGAGIKFMVSAATNFKRFIKKIGYNLKKELSGMPGIALEDKGLSLALHYRSCSAKDLPKIKKIFDGALMSYVLAGKARVDFGKKVFEVRPALNWDKGRAAQQIIAAWKKSLGRRPFAAVYIGDDTTDEDAFRALAGAGLTVRVGRKKGSRARYYLKNTKETVTFLKKIWLNY